MDEATSISNKGHCGFWPYHAPLGKNFVWDVTLCGGTFPEWKCAGLGEAFCVNFII